MEVFPTIEVIDRLYAPPGQECRFAIPVESTEDDLKLAVDGKFVTRVIYLEDPRNALPARDRSAKAQNWFEVAPGQDPLAVADGLGRPVAILRMESGCRRRASSGRGFLHRIAAFRGLSARKGRGPEDRPIASRSAQGKSFPQRSPEGNATPEKSSRGELPSRTKRRRQTPFEKRRQRRTSPKTNFRRPMPFVKKRRPRETCCERKRRKRIALKKKPRRRTLLKKQFQRWTIPGRKFPRSTFCLRRRKRRKGKRALLQPRGEETAAPERKEGGMMKYALQATPNMRWWPNPWQMLLIALCSLILCSCQSPRRQSDAMLRGPVHGKTLPGEAYAGEAYAGDQAPAATSHFPTARDRSNLRPDGIETSPLIPPASRRDLPNSRVVQNGNEIVPTSAEMEQGPPMPYTPTGPWSPPGLKKPWPTDEYIRDGGDEGRPAGVTRQAEVLGLNMEDTIAHYKKLDGQTVVEPSNEVYLYCPRFGSVRQVVSLQANEEHQKVGGVDLPVKLNSPVTLQIVSDAKQNVQAGKERSSRPAVAMRTKQGDGAMSTAVGPKGFQDGFKPYENLNIIRKGIYEASEMPFLARGSTAAIAWTHTQAVQIILDRKAAAAEVKDDNCMTIYTVEEPPARPKLRLVKVASTPFANPGDDVEFTLRFDNIGNQPIGEVTILDSLNTRLEFVSRERSMQRRREDLEPAERRRFGRGLLPTRETARTGPRRHSPLHLPCALESSSVCNSVQTYLVPPRGVEPLFSD